MDDEYIKPFIAASEIITDITGLRVQARDAYEKEVPYKSNQVIVLIGITGKIHGTVVISLDQESACGIASCMMGGIELGALDEIARSAIAELCNMMLGRVATLFSQYSINIDITPPTLLTGENIQLSQLNSTIHCIPVSIGDIFKLEINVSFQE